MRAGSTTHWSPLPRKATSATVAWHSREKEQLLVPIPEEERWHGFAAETLWASRSSSGYVLENVPFYARGLSFGDAVDARLEGGILVFAGVRRRGGHSTYRLSLAESISVWSNAFLSLWERIELLGCTFEQATHRLLAVDVPPDSDATAVRALLERGLRTGVWTFDAVHCGHDAQG